VAAQLTGAASGMAFPALSPATSQAAGRRGTASLRMIACWVAYVRGKQNGPPDLADPLATTLLATRRPADLLALLAPDLAADAGITADLDALVAEHQKGR
jgi:hypothetical protein